METKGQVTHEFGQIDYKFIEPNILVFMGSLVKKDHRGKGIWKEMVAEMFARFPKGTIVQAPVVNKKLIKFFEKLGFIKVEKIEYWGSPSNAICMEGVLK